MSTGITADVIEYEHGICAIDSGFPGPRLNAIHLIVERGRAAIVDTAAQSSIPLILQALARKGLSPGDVEYVALTHIHLDHAGGAGQLMRHLPNAMLTVHPRGARHIADPGRLIEGTIAVYGEEVAKRLYGEIAAVPADRIIGTPDGTRLSLNGRELHYFDVPGHARHHVCLLDTRSGHVFAGDTFGLSYRDLDRDGRQFIFPTTSPVQFDPAALHRSIDVMASLHPPAIYVTHFSQVRDIPRLVDDLHRLIEAHERLALNESGAGPTRHLRLKEGVRRIVLDEGHRQGWRLDEDALLQVFAMDIELNAQGLGAWLDSAAR